MSSRKSVESRKSYSRQKDDDSASTSVVDHEPDIARTKSFDIARKFSESSEKIRDLKHAEKKGKKGKDRDAFKQELEMDAHQISIEELCQRFGTSIEHGLTDAQADVIRERDGENALTPAKGVNMWKVLAEHLFYGFSGLLWVGAILCLVGWGLDPSDPANLYLGIVLMLVVCLTALFSFYQDHKALKTMEGFQNMVPQFAMVKRDSQSKRVNARELVVGDVVEVRVGDKVPADIRVVAASGMKVDNSSLTGESEPQARSGEMTDENPLETRNLAFYSTSCVDGSCTGVVVQTGDHTVIGRIANLTQGTEMNETPIHIEINHFIKIISAVAITLGIIFFLFGLAVYPIITNMVFVIGIIVANVPEGLLATVTVSLTLTSQRMARKSVLVKALESVETLGSTTTICSDKTGTLTQNRMTLAHIWCDGEVYTTNTSVTQASYNIDSPCLQAVLRNCALCNTSEFEGGQDDVEVQERACVGGNASEDALVKFAQPIRDVAEFREANPKVHEMPFNSTNKYMVTIVAQEDPNDPRLLLLMKGAPERIIGRCATILAGGEELPLTDEWRNRYQEAYDTLGGMGERVLGCCQLLLDPEEFPEDYEFDSEEVNFPLEGMCFLGLTALIDPPRPAVPGAVKLCQTAGIKVVMVTGDHPITAAAIARQVNIISPESKTIDDIAAEEGVDVDEVDPARADAIVVHGTVLRDMTEEDLDQVIRYKEIVFARTSPQQKLRIVEAFQRAKCIVAVTGDGVNDSPALKRADIGIAMGIAGSDVSKEAADMILLDDNFASIVRGVEEGRLIFDNLKKSIAYTLSSNIPELAPFLAFMVIRIPLPLPTIMILCVDLGTDLIPAISLAYEEAEADIMLRRPRNAAIDRLVNARLISFSYLQIGVIQALAAMYTFIVVLGDNGINPFEIAFVEPNFSDEDMLMIFDNRIFDFDARDDALRQAQTAYFVSIVVVQWADLLICKTRMFPIEEEQEEEQEEEEEHACIDH
jgi:sodium/potassium-transporting ATPase subunit alpha